MYIDCSRRRGYDDHKHITIVNIKIREYHSLNIKDFEEPKKPVDNKRYNA
jgi:hypothetical protein